MPFDPVLAEIRFGCGLSPRLAPPGSVEEMLDGLSDGDPMARRFPVDSYDAFLPRLQQAQALRRTRRELDGSADPEAFLKAVRSMRQEARRAATGWMAAHVLRRIETRTAFRERLEGFWADHFTVAGAGGIAAHAVSTYGESAIRPHLAGRFEELLIAAVTHPVMVQYLDQDRSVGPNSAMARRAPGRHGLNENLAREVLELHTLGVGGPYTQDDVRQLAELLTGLTMTVETGRVFRPGMAEPGIETVLGKPYGDGRTGRLADIEAVLRDLARHEATARHVSGKLAVHFVSDRPDPALVDAMAVAWLDSDGFLPAVYAAMLRHEAAWTPEAGKVKRPFEFVTSACRALTVPPSALADVSEGAFRLRILGPLRLMGHDWQRPRGPDGLEEADAAWITPQGMAARLQWALGVPRLLVPSLPDPRDFVTAALGPRATERTLFAARAAESRADGVGLVLASPAFQRM